MTEPDKEGWYRPGWWHRVPGGAPTLLALGLGLALVVSIAWGLGQHRMRVVQELHLELERQRSFEQLLGRAESIELLLAKSLVTQSGCAGTMVFVDLWHEGLAAQEDLGDLPLTHFNIANPSRFMTQVADFGRYLARKCSSGGEITDSDWDYLSTLHAAAGELTLQLHEVAQAIYAGAFRWALLGGFGLDATAGSEPSGAIFGVGRGPRPGQMVEDGFGRIAAHIQDLPILIYDGPFSDHMENRPPKALPPEEVTVEQAIEVARRFAPDLLGISPTNYQAILAAEVSGPIAAYALSLRPAGAGGAGGASGTGGTGGTGAEATVSEIRMDVSKRGGQVLWFLVQGPAATAPAPAPAPGNPAEEQQGPPPDEPIRAEQAELIRAVEAARQFLLSRGFTSISPTYSVRESDDAVCQFAVVQDGVLLYPDLLQVKVRVADGQILGYDGTEYLMSHTVRDLPQPVLTISQARAKISPRVTLHGERLVLIPTPGGRELLCYEFHVKLASDPFLVYINALTGEEEVILKLIDTGDGGALVM
ncbi:MAG: germination protein YpeB [Bacillota bacterium]|nr:germination protein YpeB [Bacillota bacterium]